MGSKEDFEGAESGQKSSMQRKPTTRFSQNKFAELVQAAVNASVVELLGEDGAESFFTYLRDERGIAKDAVAQRLDTLFSVLDRESGIRGRTVGRTIVRNLYNALGLKFDENRNYRLSDHVEEALFDYVRDHQSLTEISDASPTPSPTEAPLSKPLSPRLGKLSSGEMSATGTIRPAPRRRTRTWYEILRSVMHEERIEVAAEITMVQNHVGLSSNQFRARIQEMKERGLLTYAEGLNSTDLGRDFVVEYEKLLRVLSKYQAE
jgi:predicted transcriptional regulator